jgi:carbonic anhydrase
MNTEGTMPEKAHAALARLVEGNRKFVEERAFGADLSTARVARLAADGQHPFATVIACSDSRVVPEHLFMCGLGDIFCIRTAGNTIGPGELASAVYGSAHLGAGLLVVLGHTGCGAVRAALETGEHGALEPVLGKIRAAIGDERDPEAASVANVRAGVDTLRIQPDLARLEAAGALAIAGALYHTDTGVVEFL